jgi:hypothetical protein
MSVFHRHLIVLVTFTFLAACSAPAPTSLAPPSSQPSPEVDDSVEKTPTTTALPTVTRFPTATPNQTQTAIAQSVGTTQTAEQILIAQYPRICDSAQAAPEFSPNGLWLEELCYSDADQSPVLTFSNKDTQILWKLVYRDYIQSNDIFPEGGLAVIHWTSDGQYAYFASYHLGDGGECFIGFLDSGSGLFRLNLQTGSTTTIRPLRDNFNWYKFSFSATDRRLVYGAHSQDLKLLDITTGQVTELFPASDFDQSGDFVWSPDGLKFVYSTVLDISSGESVNCALRLVDAQSGGERILLESPDNCFAARSWSENNILTIERYDKNYERTLVEYDLNSNTIISEATATP